MIEIEAVKYFLNQTLDSIGFIQNNKNEIKIKPRFKVPFEIKN
jgi:hypothetical protein